MSPKIWAAGWEWVSISFVSLQEENGTQITQIIEHKSWRMNLCKINKHKNVTVNHKCDITNQTVTIVDKDTIVDRGRLLIGDKLKDQCLNNSQVFS